jgi:autotransporter-associated beta strand protein
MRYLVALLTISVGVPISATTIHAQTTYVWQDTTTSWTTPTAWNPNGPADWFAGQRLTDTLVSFGSQATIQNQPSLDNNVLVRGISIDNSQAAWDISSSFGALNVGSGGLSVMGLGTKTTMLSASVHITTAQTWTIGEGMTVNATNTFSDSGNFTKAGPGVLILAGDSTHMGSITATAGGLVLKGDRSAATGFVRGEGAIIQLANGTVLGGDVGFQASQGGTAAAQTNSPNFFGDSPGHVTIMGTMEVEKDGIVQFDIDGVTAGTQYDRVDVGNLRLAQNGEAFLDLVVSGFTPTVGQSFFIINNQGSSPIVGEFTNAPQNSLISSGGHFFAITYFADADTLSLAGGNDIALISVASPTPVPEPTLLLNLVATMLLVGSRRRRC